MFVRLCLRTWLRRRSGVSRRGACAADSAGGVFVRLCLRTWLRRRSGEVGANVYVFVTFSYPLITGNYWPGASGGQGRERQKGILLFLPKKREERRTSSSAKGTREPHP